MRNSLEISQQWEASWTTEEKKALQYWGLPISGPIWNQETEKRNELKYVPLVTSMHSPQPPTISTPILLLNIQVPFSPLTPLPFGNGPQPFFIYIFVFNLNIYWVLLYAFIAHTPWQELTGIPDIIKYI